MRSFMLVILLSLLMGCFSEMDYAEGYWTAHCERVLECYDGDSADALSYDDVDQCVVYNEISLADTRAEVEAEDCAYAPQAAQDCIDELASVSCDDFLSGDFMEACEAVCAD